MAATSLSGMSSSMRETVSRKPNEEHYEKFLKWSKTENLCVPATDTNTPGFPYCGDIASTYTTGPSATIYYTECNIIPQTVERQDRIKMYKTEVDLTLTCYTDEGESILGNT